MSQKFQGDPKIVYCRALSEKRAHVTCVEDGLPTWVAEVCIPLPSMPQHARSPRHFSSKKRLGSLSFVYQGDPMPSHGEAHMLSYSSCTILQDVRAMLVSIGAQACWMTVTFLSLRASVVCRSWCGIPISTKQSRMS